MAREVDKTPASVWKEKDALESGQVKSIKRLKSPKKSQECKKFTSDVKIEDVFLNSEYFKHQNNGNNENMSTLSFCSGDNGENHWTVDSKFELPIRQSSVKKMVTHNETIKSDTAVVAEKNYKSVPGKLKSHSSSIKENPQEKTEKFLEGILSGKGRFDRDLITLITEQMFLAERELQITRTHLIETISKLNERDLEIIQLHEKIDNLLKTKNPDSFKLSNREKSETPMTKSSEDYQRLVMASEKLKKQVKDMEEFLNDYGLVWVGEKETQKPDFDKIIKSFQRLNAIASHPKIIQTTLGAKFELPREITVVLYENGILLQNRDFRDYNKISTTLFLQDVEDGYFPSELQTEFPEGVPFEVLDKRNETYNPNDKIPIFRGNGNRLGSSVEGKPSKVVLLEPMKQNRQESHLSHEFSEKFKKLQKKRSFMQDDIHFKIQRGSAHKICVSCPEKTEDPVSLLRVKIRYGKENTHSFLQEVAENRRMLEFEKELQKNLCKRFHNECIQEPDSVNKNLDFEIHVYGQSPFRLSERLGEYPKDCGIVNNCLINVTEI